MNYHLKSMYSTIKFFKIFTMRRNTAQHAVAVPGFGHRIEGRVTGRIIPSPLNYRVWVCDERF